MHVGIVKELRRFPVKSMMGEDLAAVAVTSRGLVGDRVRALIDTETGKVATAKLPHRWRAMLEFRAYYIDAVAGSVVIIFPDGVKRHEEDGLETSLSAVLGRRVRVDSVRSVDLLMDRANPDAVAESGVTKVVETAVLPVGMGAPEGGFFDYAPVHFVTTASLEAIAKDSLAGVSEAVRFRPNIVIQTVDATPFTENKWVGGSLAIGNEVRLNVTLPTPRCAVPTLQHGLALPDPRLTTNIGKRNRVPVLDMGLLACLGAYAEVTGEGQLKVGDAVRWEAD